MTSWKDPGSYLKTLNKHSLQVMRLDLFLDRCADNIDGFLFNLGVTSAITLVFLCIEDQCGKYFLCGLLDDK